MQTITPSNGTGKDARRRNFTMIPNELIDTKLASLTGAEVCTFLVLMRKAINGIATLDHKYLAQKVGCKRRGTQLALDGLVRKGFIETSPEPGQANRYKLLLRVDGGSHSTTHPAAGDAHSTTQAVRTPVRGGSAHSTTHQYLDKTTTTKTGKETNPKPPARKRAGGGVALSPWKRLPRRLELMAAMSFEERLPMWSWTEEEWVDFERGVDVLDMYFVTEKGLPN